MMYSRYCLAFYLSEIVHKYPPVSNKYPHEICVSMKRCGFTAWMGHTAPWS